MGILLHHQQRLSNIELVRIVAMAMIVVGHFLLSFGLWNGSTFISRQDVSNPAHSYSFVILYGFCVVGVNLFILISGFFSIRLTWKSFLSFYLLCLFYNALAFIIETFVFDAFSWKGLVKVFLVDKTINWFFRAYFWLLLLSPLLNKALEYLSIPELQVVVILLVFLNCFSGFLLREYNENGYNVYNFVFLYVLGNWLNKEPIIQKIPRWKAFTTYVIGCLLTSIVAIILLALTDYSIRQVFAYNNPLVVLASIGLFLYFAKLDFKCNVINIIASTVVAALFIQHLFFMLHPSLTSMLSPIAVFLLVTPIIFIIAFAIEYPRRLLADVMIAFISAHLIPDCLIKKIHEQ